MINLADLHIQLKHLTIKLKAIHSVKSVVIHALEKVTDIKYKLIFYISADNSAPGHLCIFL